MCAVSTRDRPAWLWAPGGLDVFDPAINAFLIVTAMVAAPIVVTAAKLDVRQNAPTPIAW